jgi:hypothetical protein
MTKENKYIELRKIDVGEHIEKKNNLSYLSWAWAVDVLLQNDPLATWEYKEPVSFGETLMVFCTVNAFGKTMTAQLPVMDYKNKAVPNPDAFAVNTAMQRCLAKAIALHGLGLYIYAGEDLPEAEPKEPPKPIDTTESESILEVAASFGLDTLKKAWEQLDKPIREALKDKLANYKELANKHDVATTP